MITIELTDEDAERYKLFCQHYDRITLLIEQKVFETKGGAIMLHFDAQGVLQNIVKPKTSYEVLYSLSKKT